jgi:hypothetical protein
MKKFAFLLTLLLLLVVTSYAQTYKPGDFRKVSLSLDLFNDFWQKVPTGVDAANFNRGVNVNLLINNHIGESNFDFSFGGAIGVHNLYTDSWLTAPGDSSFFVKIPDSLNSTKYKITLAYFDFPLEIRYRSKGSFRAYAGIKFGVLIDHHSKYKGLDPYGAGYNVTLKRDDVRFVNFWRYQAYAKVGYKQFSVFGAIALDRIFKTSQGPDMYPISVGISINPF